MEGSISSYHLDRCIYYKYKKYSDPEISRNVVYINSSLLVLTGTYDLCVCTGWIVAVQLGMAGFFMLSSQSYSNQKTLPQTLSSKGLAKFYKLTEYFCSLESSASQVFHHIQKPLNRYYHYHQIIGYVFLWHVEGLLNNQSVFHVL